MKLRWILWIYALSLWSVNSMACTLPTGYIAPSNYDLVKSTEAIVIAQPTSFRRGAQNEYGGEFRFRVIRTLKGTLSNAELLVGGTDLYSGKSDEHNFASPRPGAFTAECFAYDYRVRKLFVLFLKRTDSGWIVSGPPLTRINEEVDSVESPWVIAIEHYLKISSLKNYETEKVELKRLQEVALKNLDTPLYPLGLAQDIQRHFAIETRKPPR